jgi:hypothetical protein
MRSPDTPVEPNHLRDLLERFADGSGWDDRSTMEAAYNDHNDVVRRDVPAGQLVEWRASEGWDPLAAALGVPVPDEAFPWNNRRENWRD